MTSFRPHHWSRLDSGLNLLFLSIFPLMLWVFQGSFSGIATAVALIWLHSIALRLISKGQKLHDAFDDANVARHPRLPRKILGSALMGLVVFVLAGHIFDALLLPVLCGALAAMLSLLAFGPDPLHDKGTEDTETQRRMETDAALEIAETELSDIADAVAALGDAELVRRTEIVHMIVMRQLRHTADRATAFGRVRAVSDKLIAILSAEVARLTEAQGPQEMRFARRRFLAKLDLIRESIEARATSPERRAREDAFDREADRLLHRMPQESAA